MKKFLIYFLIISVLVLCACRTKQYNCSEIQQKSKTSIIETDSENKNTKEIDDVNADLQNKKEVINVDAQTTKMYFRNSNVDDISQTTKEHIVDKNSQFSKYKKDNIKSKSISFLGTEYIDIPYYESKINQYTGENNDVFKNEQAEIAISQDGTIKNFINLEGIQVFSGANKNEEENARKYLDLLHPDFKYDIVKKYEPISGIVDYQFLKTFNGIPTTDGISIWLNSKGELCAYAVFDVGKYDHIEINDFNIDDFLRRINEYLEEAYKGVLINYTIGERGARYDIFEGNKLELSFPIVIKTKSLDGREILVTEEVVFELN